MGRIGLTKEQIYDAAQFIAASGNIPTTKAVRDILGSGSASTIHKHLLQWKQKMLVKPLNANDVQTYVKLVFMLEHENSMLKKQIQDLKAQAPVVESKIMRHLIKFKNIWFAAKINRKFYA